MTFTIPLWFFVVLAVFALGVITAYRTEKDNGPGLFSGVMGALIMIITVLVIIGILIGKFLL